MAMRCGIAGPPPTGIHRRVMTQIRRVCVSSREDSGRYRGRRRAPTPPRARYAAVATTALVGAGMVALATAHAMPDVKVDPAALNSANLSAGSSSIDVA